MPIYSGFSHEKWWFSIAMLVYQRVWLILETAFEILDHSNQCWPTMKHFPIPFSKQSTTNNAWKAATLNEPFASWRSPRSACFLSKKSPWGARRQYTHWIKRLLCPLVATFPECLVHHYRLFASVKVRLKVRWTCPCQSDLPVKHGLLKNPAFLDVWFLLLKSAAHRWFISPWYPHT